MSIDLQTFQVRIVSNLVKIGAIEVNGIWCLSISILAAFYYEISTEFATEK